MFSWYSQVLLRFIDKFSKMRNVSMTEITFLHKYLLKRMVIFYKNGKTETSVGDVIHLAGNLGQ